MIFSGNHLFKYFSPIFFGNSYLIPVIARKRMDIDRFRLNIYIFIIRTY